MDEDEDEDEDEERRNCLNRRKCVRVCVCMSATPSADTVERSILEGRGVAGGERN